MRTRVFEDDLRSATYRGYMTRNGVYVYNYTYPYTSSITRSKMEDVVVPNFKKRQMKGEIFQNPYAKSQIAVKSVPARMVRTGYENFVPTKFLIQEHSFLVDAPSVNTDFHIFSSEHSLTRFLGWEDLINPAISASWANVDLSEIQILASLGELPETIRWITSIFQRALNLIKLFRAKKLLAAAGKVLSKGSAADSLSDVWLEFRYALRPLVFEMHQAIAALDSHVQKATRQTARGFNRDKQATTTIRTVGNTNDVYWKQ